MVYHFSDKIDKLPQKLVDDFKYLSKEYNEFLNYKAENNQTKEYVTIEEFEENKKYYLNMMKK